MRERSSVDAAAPAAIFLLAFLLHWLQGRAIASPWQLPEELDTARAARSLVGVGQGGGATLYSALAAPLWSGTVATGYALSKVIGALLVAGAAVPTYSLARRHAGAGSAAAAAALVAAAPATVAASTVSALPLAYIMAAAGLVALERFLHRRSVRNGAIAMSILALAAAAWPPALWLVVPALVLTTLTITGRRTLRWPGAAAVAIAPAVAYAAFHLARKYSTAFASGTDDAPRALLLAVEFLGSFVIGIGLLPVVALARGRMRSAYAVAFLLAPLALGAGVIDDPYLLLLGLPAVSVAAAWSVDQASSRRTVVAVAVIAAATLGAAGRGSWAALGGLLGLTTPELSFGLVLVSGVVVLSLVLAAGIDRTRLLAVPVLGGVAIAVALVGEVAAARDARDAAGTRTMLPTHGGIGLLAGATTQPRSLDDLLFWNPNAAVVDLASHTIEPTTGAFVPPLPQRFAYLDLAGVGLSGSEIGRRMGAPLVRAAGTASVVATTEGVYADGWTDDHAVYRRFSGAQPRRIVLSLSRAGWSGPTPPDRVSVSMGPLDGKQAHERNVVVGDGKTVRLVLAAPRIPFRLDVRSQTFSPSSFGGADSRELGVQLGVGLVTR